jgi:hypothetical protein
MVTKIMVMNDGTYRLIRENGLPFIQLATTWLLMARLECAKYGISTLAEITHYQPA